MSPRWGSGSGGHVGAPGCPNGGVLVVGDTEDTRVVPTMGLWQWGTQRTPGLSPPWGSGSGGHMGTPGVPTPGSRRRGPCPPGCPLAVSPPSPSPQTRRGSDSEKRSLDSRGEGAGSGRAIPIKQVSGARRGAAGVPGRPLPVPSPTLRPQSFLLKRSGNSLNKEWKKKYVTLASNGLLFYHPSINVSVPVPTAVPAAAGTPTLTPGLSPRQDYIHSTHGKEMDLLRTTVKVPGKRPPRAISACGPSASINGLVKDVGGGTAPEAGGE